MSSAIALPALPALTTPFVPPPRCTDQFITTSYTTESSLVTVLVSGPVDPRFATCQPSGWDAGESSFEFKPAVCPSGWTAYELGATTSDVDTTHWVALSSAYCCSGGFGFTYINFPVDGISSLACFQSISAEATTASEPSNGLRVHNAWHIAWESSDIRSLSPTPPQLPCSTRVIISSWVPGATLDLNLSRGSCEDQPQDNLNFRTSGPDFWVLFVILPIIGVVIITISIWVCCHRCRRKKRRAEPSGDTT